MDEQPPTTGEPVSVTRLYADQYCRIRAPEVRVIDDANGLAAFFAEQAGETRIDGPTTPTVDFAAAQAVLVALGRRATGGFDLALAPDGATLFADGTLQLGLIFAEPEEGAMVTQALTSPCLLVQVPRAGVERIIVTDRDARVRFAISVDPGGDPDGQTPMP